MLKHPHLTMRRLERFLDDSLESKLIGTTVPLSLAICRDPAVKDEAGARKAVFQPVDKGYKWGPVWSNAWFRITGAVPEGWIGEKVQAVIQTGAETTVWRDNSPWEALD
jgi:alpha-mannosidase